MLMAQRMTLRVQQTKAPEACSGKNDGVEASFFKALQTCRHIATQVGNDEISATRKKLAAAAQA